MLQKHIHGVLKVGFVVNRFQNFVSLHASKTFTVCVPPNVSLWIAFKILYLCMLQKRFGVFVLRMPVVNRFQNFVSLHASKTALLKAKTLTGCESLSKFCIFACFKNAWNKGKNNTMLWIAFKILYLCMLQKLLQNTVMPILRCESLSKFCIFACFKNAQNQKERNAGVVNRFQNFVSLHASKTDLLRQSENQQIIAKSL